MMSSAQEKVIRENLYVQLKILKELRLLNRNLRTMFPNYESTSAINQHELDDVKDALAESGYVFV